MEQNEIVKVYYCKCGKSIQCAAHPKLFEGSTIDAKRLRKEFKEAEVFGFSVAEISIEDYRKTPFMCYDKSSDTGVVDGCVDLKGRMKAELLYDEVNKPYDSKKFTPGGFVNLERKKNQSGTK